MRAAGYTDVERGERDSTEEHLTVTQFKVAKEKRLSLIHISDAPLGTVPFPGQNNLSLYAHCEHNKEPVP